MAALRRPSSAEDVPAFRVALVAELEMAGVERGERFRVEKVVEDGDALNFVAGSRTSRRAAIDSYPRRSSQKRRILMEVAQAGAEGLTSDEAEDRTGLRHQSCSARLVDLRKADLVEHARDEHGFVLERSTASGSDAAVHVLSPRGRREVFANEGRLF